MSLSHWQQVNIGGVNKSNLLSDTINRETNGNLTCPAETSPWFSGDDPSCGGRLRQLQHPSANPLKVNNFISFLKERQPRCNLRRSTPVRGDTLPEPCDWWACAQRKSGALDEILIRQRRDGAGGGGAGGAAMRETWWRCWRCLARGGACWETNNESGVISILSPVVLFTPRCLPSSSPQGEMSASQ